MRRRCYSSQSSSRRSPNRRHQPAGTAGQAVPDPGLPRRLSPRLSRSLPSAEPAARRETRRASEVDEPGVSDADLSEPLFARHRSASRAPRHREQQLSRSEPRKKVRHERRSYGHRRHVVSRRADLGHRGDAGDGGGLLFLAGIGGGNRRCPTDVCDAVRREGAERRSRTPSARMARASGGSPPAPDHAVFQRARYGLAQQPSRFAKHREGCALPRCRDRHTSWTESTGQPSRLRSTFCSHRTMGWSKPRERAA